MFKIDSKINWIFYLHDFRVRLVKGGAFCSIKRFQRQHFAVMVGGESCAAQLLFCIECLLFGFCSIFAKQMIQLPTADFRIHSRTSSAAMLWFWKLVFYLPSFAHVYFGLQIRNVSFSFLVQLLRNNSSVLFFNSLITQHITFVSAYLSTAQNQNQRPKGVATHFARSQKITSTNETMYNTLS